MHELLPAHSGFLRFTFGATPDHLLTGSIAAKPFLSTHLLPPGNGSCGKVMFSQACVCSQVGGGEWLVGYVSSDDQVLLAGMGMSGERCVCPEEESGYV